MAEVTDTPEVLAAKRAAFIAGVRAARDHDRAPNRLTAEALAAGSGYPESEPPLVWTTAPNAFGEQWARRGNGKWVCKGADGNAFPSAWLTDALVAEMAAQLPTPEVTEAMAARALFVFSCWGSTKGRTGDMRAALEAVAPTLTRTVVVRPEGGQRVWRYKHAPHTFWYDEADAPEGIPIVTGTVYPDAEVPDND